MCAEGEAGRNQWAVRHPSSPECRATFRLMQVCVCVSLCVCMQGVTADRELASVLIAAGEPGGELPGAPTHPRTASINISNCCDTPAGPSAQLPGTSSSRATKIVCVCVRPCAGCGGVGGVGFNDGARRVSLSYVRVCLKKGPPTCALNCGGYGSNFPFGEDGRGRI